MNKLETLEKKYDDLVEEADVLDDIILHKEKQIKEVAGNLYNLYKDEFSKSIHLKPIIPNIKRMFKALEKFNYNDKLICDHSGICIYTGIWEVTMTNKHPVGKPHTLLIFKIKQKYIHDTELGVKKQCFNKIKSLIKSKFSIVTYWNGEEDHNSISIVINKALPKSLATALDNYSNYNSNHNTFGFPTDTFTEVFERNYKKLEVKK